MSPACPLTTNERPQRIRLRSPTHREIQDPKMKLHNAMKVLASLKSQLQDPKMEPSAYFSRRERVCNSSIFAYDYFPKKPLLLSLEAVPFTEQSSLPLLLIILICCECFGAFVHGWCQKTVHSLDLLSIDEICLASAYMKSGERISYSSSTAIFLNFKLFQSHLNPGPFKFVSHTNFHSIERRWKDEHDHNRTMSKLNLD